MTEAEIYPALTEIFRELFLNDAMELTPDLSAKNVPGWDSFKQIEIMVATEQRFRMKMSMREQERMQNLGDLVRLIAAKTGN